MATVLDTSDDNEEGNAALEYLHEQKVVLTTEQIKLFLEMQLTLEDLCNMSIETDFIEFCGELDLSFAPKIKLKSAIIKLQSRQKKQISSEQNTKLEVLMSMGFDEAGAVAALKTNDNDIVKSAQYLTAQKLSSDEKGDEKDAHVELEESKYDVDLDQLVSQKLKVETLVSMGFDKQNSEIALRDTHGHVDITKVMEKLKCLREMDTVFSRPDGDKDIPKITIALIGNSGVGKSSILTRLMDHTFDEQRVETLGVDYREKEMTILDTRVKLRVLDTAGQERFRSISAWYYRVSHAFIVVFDITDKQSFLDLKHWLNQVNQRASDSANRFLVGTKIDLQQQRMVAFHEAITYAQSNNFRYCEVSAKSGRNINQLFITAVLYVLRDARDADLVEDSKSHSTRIIAADGLYSEEFRPRANIDESRCCN
eukprot:783671_1